MRTIYSTYEAKTRFSEILKQVRAGQSVWVSYHGRTVAEIRPVAEEPTWEERVERFAAAGVLVVPEKSSRGRLRPLAQRQGALRRFLEDRD